MSRGARERSSNGVYHVMLRGINRQAIAELRHFHAEHVQTARMDIAQGLRPSDAEVRALLLELCGTNQAAELQMLPIPQRDRAIAALKERSASLRQIVQLTGWSFGVVRSR